MSLIDSENIETCITSATFDDLEKALKSFGYNVTRTKLQITATHGGYWSTNGHLSTITIIDKGDYRECQDIETAKGYMCTPEKGLLAKIINYAESPERLDKETVVNPTSEKQGSIMTGVVVFSVVFILIMIALYAALLGM